MKLIWLPQSFPLFSLKTALHLRQFAIQLFDSFDEIENYGGARVVDSQISPQPLHAAKLNHNTARHSRFICATLNRVNQTTFGESHYE
jgi:hypothetical protein